MKQGEPTNVITVRIPTRTNAQIERLAAESGMGRNAVVQLLLSLGLKESNRLVDTDPR